MAEQSLAKGLAIRKLIDGGWKSGENVPATVIDTFTQEIMKHGGELLREALNSIPQGNFYRCNRYDTDDEMVLTIYADGNTYDVRCPKMIG